MQGNKQMRQDGLKTALIRNHEDSGRKVMSNRYSDYARTNYMRYGLI